MGQGFEEAAALSKIKGSGSCSCTAAFRKHHKDRDRVRVCRYGRLLPSSCDWHHNFGYLVLRALPLPASAPRLLHLPTAKRYTTLVHSSGVACIHVRASVLIWQTEEQVFRKVDAETETQRNHKRFNGEQEHSTSLNSSVTKKLTEYQTEWKHEEKKENEHSAKSSPCVNNKHSAISYPNAKKNSRRHGHRDSPYSA